MNVKHPVQALLVQTPAPPLIALPGISPLIVTGRKTLGLFRYLPALFGHAALHGSCLQPHRRATLGNQDARDAGKAGEHLIASDSEICAAIAALQALSALR